METLEKMHVETPSTKVARTDKVVFDFLTDIKNFEILMPDSIDKFEVLDDTTFKFALKGMPEIVLRLQEQVPNSKVVLAAASDKLPFTLTGNITPFGENESKVGLSFEGDFNAMMAMMVKAPITSFMETLTKNMDRIP